MARYPNANLADLSATVEDFVTTVDDLYGHYLDSTMGFSSNHKLLIRAQEESRKILPPETDLDEVGFFCGRGNPNDPANRLLHTTTQREFKRRNAKGGKNHVRAAQLLLVSLYTFWEHEYRPRLATSLGLQTDALRIPLLGDVRLLRNDVIHNKGAVTEGTITRLSVLQGFQEREQLNLSDQDVEELIRKIKGAVDEVVVDAGGTDPLHRTLWHVQ